MTNGAFFNSLPASPIYTEFRLLDSETDGADNLQSSHGSSCAGMQWKNDIAGHKEGICVTAAADNNMRRGKICGTS
jgi:hypothetical protein